MDDNCQKIALEIQTRLLQHFITLVRSSDEEEMLKITLQKTVDLAAEMTGAEKGSLFLLDPQGVVTDRIMMRETSSREDSARLIGTVLDKGLAGWVVNHREVGLIADTLEDARWLQFSDQPYRARSAIVTPILKGDNLFGILSLVHSAPHRFSTATTALLKATTDHVAIVLENAKLYQSLNEAFHALASANAKIETYSKALSAELEKGRHMQRTFLPAKMPDIHGWKIDACFHPAQQVSGDFYDVFAIDEQQLAVIIADVCDKGVSAALFMGIFRSLIHAYLEGAFEFGCPTRAALKIREKPGSSADRTQGALSFLNSYIEKHHGREGIFATLFFGILHTDDGRLDYINAGHEPLMIIRGNSVARELPPTGPAIGIAAEARFTLASIRLAHGETLIGFTDGITDACSTGSERFGRTGIYASIERCNPAGPTLMNSILHDVFRHLEGRGLTDDIAMFSITRMPERQ